MKFGLIKALFVGAILMLLSGCASLGPAYEPVRVVPAGKALVYIYRSPKFVGSAVSYDIHHNDKVITRLASGGYFPYITNPGEVELWAKTESRASVTLDLKPGDVKYVKGDIGVGFMVGRPKLTVVSNAKGESEIGECKLIPEPEKK